jgi:hypothetical protein
MEKICFYSLCVLPLEVSNPVKIFGFAEFLTALALLAIVYTTTDFRYRFRIATVPGPLFASTFLVITLVGIESLLTEVWVNEHLYVPVTSGLTYYRWQAFFGLLFMVTCMTWIYYGFLRPPRFGRRNAKKYTRAIVAAVLRGSEADLAVLASEVGRSIPSLVAHAAQARQQFAKNGAASVSDVNGAAHDLFGVLADIKMCNAFVVSAPGTIRAFFLELAKREGAGIVAADFARNLTVQALKHAESFIYTEAAGREGGAIAQYRMITSALYGNYSVVEAAAQSIGHFDIEYRTHRNWGAMELRGYCDIVLVHVKSSAGEWMEGGSARAFAVALRVIESNISFLRFNDAADLDFYSENSSKLNAVVEFFSDTISALNEVAIQKNLKEHELESFSTHGPFHSLAKLFVAICEEVSRVEGNPGTIWSFYHNRVWGRIFDLTGDGPAQTTVIRTAFKLLITKVKYLETMSHYGSAQLLRMLLTVLGLVPHAAGGNKLIRTMGRWIRHWTRRNFMSIDQRDPEIAALVGTGMLGFDRGQKRISKTYLGRNPSSDHLILD